MSVSSLTAAETGGSYEASSLRRYRIGLVLAIVQLAIAAVVWGSNNWTGAMALIVGASQLVVIGLIDLRIRSRESDLGRGNVIVQHSWFVLSMGIAGAAVFSSSFFEVDVVWMAIAVAINLVWALLGAYMIYWSVRVTDARATI